MSALAGQGIFLGGLGLFFIGTGVLWWISILDAETKRDATRRD